MTAARWWMLGFGLAVVVLPAGCMVPQTQLNTAQTQNRALTEQNRAQLVEIENLKVHSRNVENQLMRAEQDLALLEKRGEQDRQRLASYERERTELHDQFQGLVRGRTRVPGGVTKQLTELAQRYPSLRFDPATGIGRLDTDILFDSGQAELKPGATGVLQELVRLLKSPEAAELRIMVVGHTDDRRIAGKAVREQFPTNFHLSTARALAVAEALRKAGLGEERIGVAGFSQHQPMAPNVSAVDRQKNRRVEIFVMCPDVPVVGWTDSVPSVYH